MGRYLILIVFLLVTVASRGQVVKSNLVYDATLTGSLGFEFRSGGRTSVDLPLSYNCFSFSGNRKWKHVLVQPGFRYWFLEGFGGFFAGVHGHWGYYNFGRVPASVYMRERHFEGSLVGGGLSVGYRFDFGRGGRRHSQGTYSHGDGELSAVSYRSHASRTAGWGLEFEFGVGYAYLDYKMYECGYCGDYLGIRRQSYFGPTKVAVNLLYAFGGYSGNPRGVLGRVGRVRRGGVVDVSAESVGGVLPGVLSGFVPTFVVPPVEPRKDRSDSIRADLEFVFDVGKLDPGYRDNASELRRLRGAVDEIRGGRHTAVRGVRITGYASPEGTERYNMTLSEQRAQSVRDYLESVTTLPSQLFTIKGEGERPDGLRAMVDVDYTVDPFTLDEARRMLHTRPQLLSVDEMYQLACTHTPGSAAYREVFEICARTFPKDDVANINAAAAALMSLDADVAARYLERVTVQGPAWWDNVGIVFYLRGDYDRSAAAFINAGTTGLDNAATLRRLTEAGK